jgi:uncharacterized protein YkwD
LIGLRGRRVKRTIAVRHHALLGLAITLSVTGCSSSNPAYRPGSPGQWGGDGARAGYPWQPPPSPSTPPPRATGQPMQPPNLVGTAVSAINVLLGSLPPPPQLPLPWAVPQQQPGPSDTPSAWAAFEDEVLARTNDKRAAGAVCGGRAMPPAPPVVTHPTLRASARGHSRDMALRDYFSHTTPEGAGPGARAQGAGFQGSLVGENIAAGQVDPARVVQAWMESPGHCENLMDPRYRYLGVGYFRDGANDRFEHYWTQNFGG